MFRREPSREIGPGRVAAAVVLALAATRAAAEPPRVLFLAVERSGRDVAARFVDGDSAAAVPWPSGGVEWMFTREAGAQHNRHDVVPPRPSDPALLPAAEDAVTTTGADLGARKLEVSVAELCAFAERAGASDAVDRLAALPPDVPLTVRHVLSAKALHRPSRTASGSSAIATSKTGQAVEIRVHLDPTGARAGSDLPLTTYVDGDKRPGMRVRATSAATGKVHAFSTDAGGTGHFPLDDAGAWHVEAHHLVAPPTDGGAWTLSSATLAFEVHAREVSP